MFEPSPPRAVLGLGNCSRPRTPLPAQDPTACVASSPLMLTALLSRREKQIPRIYTFRRVPKPHWPHQAPVIILQ